MAIQPLEDGKGHKLVPITLEPDKINENVQEDENSKLKDGTDLAEKSENKYELKKDTAVAEKTTLPVESNPPVSELLDPIGWLYHQLGYTTNNTNSSKNVDTVGKNVENNDSSAGVESVPISKLRDTGKENESSSKTGEEKPFSIDEQSSKMVERHNESDKSQGKTQLNSVLVEYEDDAVSISKSDKNCYGNVCTYVVLGSSTIYFYHVSNRF